MRRLTLRSSRPAPGGALHRRHSSNVRPLVQDVLYMLPGEFVAVVVFLFAPPLILSLVVQTVVFAIRGVFARGHFSRAVVGYLATLVGSLGVGF